MAHEYCPPEQVEPEQRRYLDPYNDDDCHRTYPVNLEAAWPHHRFGRTHPLQDGNGRVCRQLVAWASAKRSLPPPVITARGKLVCIIALEAAGEGKLTAISNYAGNRSAESLRGANPLARQALAGKLIRSNGNGGRAVGEQNLPPLPGDMSGDPFGL